MLGVDIEHLRLEGPMLVYLRWQLHKVTLYVCHAAVVDIAHKAVQGMPELMEHCLHVVDGLKSWLVSTWRGHAANVDNYGLNPVATVVPLSPERCTPCSGSLAVAWHVVAIEYGEQGGVGIVHLPCLCRGLIGRSLISDFLERYAIELVGNVEYPFQYVVYLKILR